MRRPLKLDFVIGTRPEAIKLAPVILTARARPGAFAVRVIRTGQHRELVDHVMQEFGIGADVNLDVMQRNQGLASVMAECVRGLSEVIAADPADWVIVQGDTTSTFAGALAAFYNRVRVGHVEAGLRTGHRDRPFPEEANRSMTACLADLHFAPTPGARLNMLKEGIAGADIFVTGNTVVDALMSALRGDLGDEPFAPPMGDAPYLLVTAHRRENHGPALHRICDALIRVLACHPDLHAWMPVHPSPVVREAFDRRMAGHRRVHLTEPLGYVEFVHALSAAALVLTDSGGVQEECAALGRPVLVLRDDTERAEGVDAGVALLVGTDTDRIVATASHLLDDQADYRAMAHPTQAFGSGSASQQILDALAASAYNGAVSRR